jgi:hypothetical protein
LQSWLIDAIRAVASGSPPQARQRFPRFFPIEDGLNQRCAFPHSIS